MPRNIWTESMKTRLSLRPGQRGAKKLAAQYGDRLVCVRYRYDEKRKKRLKTVELIVEEFDWEPPKDRIAADSMVSIHVDLKEKELQNKVKRAGGKWNQNRKAWDIRYDKVLELGLEARMGEGDRI